MREERGAPERRVSVLLLLLAARVGSEPTYELVTPSRLFLNASSPTSLALAFDALGRSFDLRLSAEPLLARGASVVSLAAGRARVRPAADVLRTYATTLDHGRGWARVTLGERGAFHAAIYTRDAAAAAAAAPAPFRLFRLAPVGSLGRHAGLGKHLPDDAIVFYHGELPEAERAPGAPGCGAHGAHARARPSPPAASSGRFGAARGRALAEGGDAAVVQGGTVAERAGRLCYCPRQPDLLLLSIGLVLDRGFVAAAGGADAARLEVAQALQLVNTVFSEQLGVYFELAHLRVNEDDSASFAEGGPNHAPSGGRSGSCAAPVSSGRNAFRARAAGSPPGKMVSVLVEGEDVLLSQMAAWASEHAPPPPRDGRPLAAWHLLTACWFGPQIGIATVGTACRASASATTVRDSGKPCDGCQLELANGNEGVAVGLASELRAPCTHDAHCSGGNVGVTVRVTSDALWRTLAHELGHNLNAPHATAGLMAPAGTLVSRPRFQDDGTLCAFLNALTGTAPASGAAAGAADARADACVGRATRTCGNGRVEFPEECDDGNSDAGDGCTADCSRETHSPLPPPPYPPFSPPHSSPPPTPPIALSPSPSPPPNAPPPPAATHALPNEIDPEAEPLETCPEPPRPRAAIELPLTSVMLIVTAVLVTLVSCGYAAWAVWARRKHERAAATARATTFAPVAVQTEAARGSSWGPGALPPPYRPPLDGAYLVPAAAGAQPPLAGVEMRAVDDGDYAAEPPGWGAAAVVPAAAPAVAPAEAPAPAPIQRIPVVYGVPVQRGVRVQREDDAPALPSVS